MSVPSSTAVLHHSSHGSTATATVASDDHINGMNAMGVPVPHLLSMAPTNSSVQGSPHHGGSSGNASPSPFATGNNTLTGTGALLSAKGSGVNGNGNVSSRGRVAPSPLLIGSPHLGPASARELPQTPMTPMAPMTPGAAGPTSPTLLMSPASPKDKTLLLPPSNASTATTNGNGNGATSGKKGTNDGASTAAAAVSIAEQSAKAVATSSTGGVCCHRRCPSRRSCKTWWKLFLPSFLGVAIVAVLIYLWRANAESQENLANQERSIATVMGTILSKLLFVAGDQRVLADAAANSCITARPFNNPPIPCSFSALATALPSFLKYRGYNYIRLLNATGFEQSTGYFNRTSLTASLLPRAQLQDLSRVPQWQILHNTPWGETSVAKIADVRGTVTSGTAVPSWFLSVNVPNNLGNIAGSVGIDYNVDIFLAAIEAAGMMLVNTDGYWLAGAPDGYSTFGFNYPVSDKRRASTFEALWPDEWNAMVGRQHEFTDYEFNYTDSNANTQLSDVKSMGEIYNMKTTHGSFVYSPLCWSFLLGPRVPLTATCPDQPEIRFFLVSYESIPKLSPDAVRFSTAIWIAGFVLMLGWGCVAGGLTRASNARALAEEEASYNRKLADQALSTQRLVVGPMAKLAAHLDMARHKKAAPKVTTIVAAIPPATATTGGTGTPATPTRAGQMAAAASIANGGPTGATTSGDEKDGKVVTGKDDVQPITTRTLTVADIPALGSLDTLLEDEFCSRYFNSFLLREWTSENLLFYNDVRAFRSTMMEAAELIFNLYIADHADFQVNIPSRGTARIATQLAQPHAGMFDDAQTEVKKLLTLNSFPRFFESDICNDMMAEINRKAQSGRHYDSSEGSKRSSGKGSGKASGNGGAAGGAGGNRGSGIGNNGAYDESRHSAGGVTVVVSQPGPATPATQSRIGVATSSQAAQRLSHQKAVANAFIRASGDTPESPTAGDRTVERGDRERGSPAPGSSHFHPAASPLGNMPMSPLAIPSPPPSSSPVNGMHGRQRSSPVPHHNNFGAPPHSSHGSRPPLHSSLPPGEGSPMASSSPLVTATSGKDGHHHKDTNNNATTKVLLPASSSSTSNIIAGPTTTTGVTGAAHSTHSMTTTATVTSTTTNNHSGNTGGSVVITVDRRSPSPHSRRHLMYAVQQRKREMGVAAHASFEAPDNVTTISDGPATPPPAATAVAATVASTSSPQVKPSSSHTNVITPAITTISHHPSGNTSSNANAPIPSLPGAANEQLSSSNDNHKSRRNSATLPPLGHGGTFADLSNHH